MGIEYRGQLCVGYDYGELESLIINNQDRFEGIDVDELSSREKAEVLGMGKFAPYYDADMDDCIYGWSITRGDDYSATRVRTKDLQAVEGTIQTMTDEYGLVPSIYIMAEGT